MYSKAFSANGDYVQVLQWHLFLSADVFCMKICDPAVPPSSTGGNLCENRCSFPLLSHNKR
jgi:hypothetical protein